MVFNGYGATTNENQSRFVSGAITGVYLDGDDLTSAAGQQAADSILTNAAVNSVARVGRTFTPVDGNTGTGAASVFVRQDGVIWSIAVLNYNSTATNEVINLSRVGLPGGTYLATNLLNGSTFQVSSSFNVSLKAKQSTLFQLTIPTQRNLKWSSLANTGTWDTSTTANWLNLANSQETVFNPGDSVLFDDTPGVPTSVTVNGTV